MQIFDHIRLRLTDAEKELLALARTRTRGVGRERLTVRQMAEGYLELSELRAVTRTANGHHLRFLVGLFGDRLARCVGVSDLAAFREIQSRRGVAPSTMVHRLSVYRAAVNWALRTKRLLAPSPLEGLRIPDVRSRRVAPPSKAELDRMLPVAPLHVQRVIVLGLTFGARVGPSELFRLRWPDFEPRSGLFRVPNACKGADVDFRDMPVRDDVMPLLLRWRTEDARIACPWVIHRNGRPVRSIHTAWHAARRRAGIERSFAPYGLRHAFATHTLRNQADIRAVDELMGHADESRILRVYDYVDDLARRETVNAQPGLDLSALLE